jgi:hypothetical protein
MVQCRELCNDRTRGFFYPLVQLVGLVDRCKGERIAVCWLIADDSWGCYPGWRFDARCGEPEGELFVVPLCYIRIGPLRLFVGRINVG